MTKSGIDRTHLAAHLGHPVIELHINSTHWYLHVIIMSFCSYVMLLCNELHKLVVGHGYHAGVNATTIIWLPILDNLVQYYCVLS